MLPARSPLHCFFRFCAESEHLDKDPAAARAHRQGRRGRVVPIHPALMPLIDACLATRLPLGHERTLFITGACGARLSTTIMATTFRRYAAAADGKRVTPHASRVSKVIIDVTCVLRRDEWRSRDGGGTAPVASITPASNDFRHQLLDTAATPATFTLRNVGSAPPTHVRWVDLDGLVDPRVSARLA